MTALLALEPSSLESRVRQSLGTSARAIYKMVLEALNDRPHETKVLLDVGCGTGSLWHSLRKQFSHYIGVDAVRFEGFPGGADFRSADLDTETIDLPNACADVVAALEIIEHLENPRAFVRELVRLARPGGWIAVTTPNQLSLLSKLTLLFKNRFNAFQDRCYPAHRTALLEIDLRRLAWECRLTEVAILYSHHGRIPGTRWHYPQFLSKWLPRTLSDNILLIARKT